MLKGIKKIILLIILLIPFMVIADENYKTSIDYANSYIDGFSEYQNYILFPESGYYYDETLKNDNFTHGGFLSRKEYLITNYDNKSYLSPGVQYWTLTPGLSDNAKRYVIDYTDKEYEKTNMSGVRVTEYILSNTRVNGNGTRSNPWYFLPKYKVILSASDYKKGGISDKIGNGCNNPSQILATSVYEDESIDVQLCPNSGYEYYNTDCSINISKLLNTHMIRVSNVKRNLSCKINFVVSVYKILLDTNGGSKIDTKELYLAPNRYWFKEKDDRITETQITKIDKLPTKTGYTFKGFYIDKTSDTKLIDEKGNIVSKEGYTTDGTMYARYTANEYKITFDQQEGKGGIESILATYNSAMPTITTTKLPTREGYKFTGYYSEKDGNGTQYYDAKGEGVKKWNIASDTTLYANWTPNKLNIVFNANGANKIEDPTPSIEKTYHWQLNKKGNIMRSTNGTDYEEDFYSKDYTSKINLPNYNYSNYIKLTKTGYTALSGKEWCTKPDGSGNCFDQTVDYSAEKICQDIVFGDCNITLYTNWTANQYKITLNQQLGTGGIDSVTATYASDMPKLESLPTRAGYKFNGYYSKKDGQGTKYYNANGTSDIIWKETSGKTLYAYWTPNKLNIVFNANGANKIEDPTPSIEKTYHWQLNKKGNIMRSTNGTDYIENFYSRNYTSKINLPNYNYSNYIKLTKTGYTALSGKEWCTNPDGSGKCFDQTVDYSAEKICQDIVFGDCNITLYTNWELDNTKYNCIYDGNLKQGAEYVNGQYTYRYKQQGTSSSDYTNKWTSISTDGWGVQLTNKKSTEDVTSELCSTINGKPIVSMANMFYKSQAKVINLSSFDTSNVINMSDMFYRSEVTTLDLRSFDTSNVINMSDMFSLSKATEIKGLENFNTSNVTNMSDMFGYSQVTTLNLSSFDTSKVTNMSDMFDYSRVTTLNLSSFDTSNVINMSQMFSNSKAAEIKGLENFNTSNVTNMERMFGGSQATILDLSSFDTSNVTNMERMFSGSQATILDLSSFDTSKVTNMQYMFSGSQATILDLSSFDTSNVTNMFNMFSSSKATTLDLSNFNTTNVESMGFMFAYSQAKVINLSSFDTSKVTAMHDMFYNSQATTLDLSNFNTSKVTSMSAMFFNSQATTLDLSSFDTSNVTDMDSMFSGSKATTLDLSSFDTNKVTDMDAMFHDSKATKGYARTQTDANKFNSTSYKPSGLKFVVK